MRLAWLQHWHRATVTPSGLEGEEVRKRETPPGTEPRGTRRAEGLPPSSGTVAYVDVFSRVAVCGVEAAREGVQRRQPL